MRKAKQTLSDISFSRKSSQGLPSPSFGVKTGAGFTLIELLVIAAIGVLITIAAANIFFSTLLSGGKSTTTSVVKQNGDFAITEIERAIRNAKSVDPTVTACSASGETSNTLGLINQDDTTTQITSDLNGSYILINSNPITSVDSKFSITNGPTFVCTQENSAVPPKIDISFGIQKGVVGVDRPTDIVEVLFNGTATLRQY